MSFVDSDLNWVVLKESPGKRISKGFMAKYLYFPKTKDKGGEKSRDDIFRNKTEIT